MPKSSGTILIPQEHKLGLQKSESSRDPIIKETDPVFIKQKHKIYRHPWQQDCVENIVKNIAMWQDNGEEVLGDRLAQVKTRPESTPRTAAAEGAPLSVTKESKAGDS